VPHAATACTGLLVGRGVAISMEAVGKPEENRFAERLIPDTDPLARRRPRNPPALSPGAVGSQSIG
jgi:hypothetical protein